MNGNHRNRATGQKAGSAKAHLAPTVSPEQRGSEPRELLLTQEEIAALLQVTPRTVERWQQEGVLVYLRMGHVIRFYWPAVLEHLIANFAVCRGLQTGSGQGVAPRSDQSSVTSDQRAGVSSPNKTNNGDGHRPPLQRKTNQ